MYGRQMRWPWLCLSDQPFCDSSLNAKKGKCNLGGWPGRRSRKISLDLSLVLVFEVSREPFIQQKGLGAWWTFVFTQIANDTRLRIRETEARVSDAFSILRSNTERGFSHGGIRRCHRDSLTPLQVKTNTTQCLT